MSKRNELSMVDVLANSIESEVERQAEWEGVKMSKAEVRWIAREMALQLHDPCSTLRRLARDTMAAKRAKDAARR
jgi:hypothetical protein